MRALFLILFLICSPPASAAVHNCWAPSAAATRNVELCEILRVHLNVTVANWSTNECATEFFRRGMRDFEKQVTRRESRATVSSDVDDALDTFDSIWGIHAVVSFCGDDVVDTEFGEECDPPDAGVTCDDDCQDVP